MQSAQDKCSIREFGRYIGLSDTAIKKQMFDEEKNPSGPLKASITKNENNHRPMLFKELALTEWIAAGLTIKNKDVLAKVVPLIVKPTIPDTELPWGEKEQASTNNNYTPPTDKVLKPLSEGGTLVFSGMDGYRAKEAKEIYVAGKHELEYRKMAGDLVEKSDVYKLLFEFGQEIRSNLEQIPARIVASMLACETEREAKELLTDEINKVLAVLARGPKVYQQEDETENSNN